MIKNRPTILILFLFLIVLVVSSFRSMKSLDIEKNERFDFAPTQTFSSHKYWMFHRGRTDQATKMSSANNPSTWSIYDKIQNSGANKQSMTATIFNNQVYLMYGKESTNNIKLKKASNPNNWTDLSNPFVGWKSESGMKLLEWNGKMHLIFHAFTCSNSKNSCTDGSLYQTYFYSSSSNGTTWTTPKLLWNLSSYATYGSPSLTVFQDKLYAFMVDGENIKYATSSNGTNWQYIVQPIHGNQVDHDVSAVTYDGKIYLFFEGTDNNLYKITSTDGVNWSGRVKIPNEGESVKSPVGTMLDGNQLMISYIIEGSDKVVTKYTTDGNNWSSNHSFDNNKGKGSVVLINTSNF